MTTNKKPALYRYGLEVRSGAILAPGTTAERPAGEDGLTRVNTQLSALEWYANGKWHSVTGNALPQAAAVGASADLTIGRVYPVNAASAGISLKVPVANEGERIIIMDTGKNWDSRPITLTRETGARINGENSNYVLDRKGDAVILEWVSDTYGYRVDHAIAKAAEFVDRFGAPIEFTGNITAVANKIYFVNQGTHPNAVINLPADPDEGDEVIIIASAGTSLGTLITVGRNGKPIDRKGSNAYLNWFQPRIHFRWQGDSWRTLMDNRDEGGQIDSLDLNSVAARRHIRAYISNPTNLPFQMQPSHLAWLEVDTLTTFFKGINRAECRQLVTNLAHQQRYERYYVAGDWTQWRREVMTLPYVSVSSNQTMVRDTAYYAQVGDIVLALPPSPILGEEIEVSAPVSGDVYNVRINNNGNNIHGVDAEFFLRYKAQTVRFRYNGGALGWCVISNSHAEGRVTYSGLNMDSDDRIRAPGRFFLHNATGSMPWGVTSANNEILLESFASSSHSSSAAPTTTARYRYLLTDMRTGNQYVRYLDGTNGMIGSWKKIGTQMVRLTDSSQSIITLGDVADKVVFVVETTKAITVRISDHTLWESGSELVFINEAEANITLEGIDVIDYNRTNVGSSNTITGKGEIGFVRDHRGMLVVGVRKQ